jgi:3-dehydroquinate dehydratase
MKKIVVFLSILIATTGSITANANDSNKDLAPTIAIIDTAFDASVFGDSVIEEVCITAGGGCNNSSGFQTGAGSSGAAIEVKPRDLENWVHGNLMAKTVLESNPNAKLLLIRNSKIYGNAVLSGTEKDLAIALSWLSVNAKQYNVVAVSVSRGSHSYVSSNRQLASLSATAKLYEGMLSRLIASRANPRVIAPLQKILDDTNKKISLVPAIQCPATNGIREEIIKLQSSNIATIVATGNDANKVYVDYPACIEEAISVTAHNGIGIVHVGNVSSTTDFASQATTTSEATAKLAGLWSLVYDGEYESTYNFLKRSGIKYGNTVLVPNSF